MIDDEEREQIYEAAITHARSGMSADLRNVIDYFNAEIRALRIEICKLAGLPAPPPLDRNGHELQ